MKFQDVLTEEHRGIAAMLSVFDRAVARIARGRELPSGILAGILDFFKHFADDCHHAKEEESLFPLLGRHGITADESFVAALRAQHDAGRVYMRNLLAELGAMERGDLDARDAFVADARAYVDLLREHIRIEDEYFAWLAARTLSLADDHDLVEAFEEIERARTGAGRHEHYQMMIADLQRKAASW